MPLFSVIEITGATILFGYQICIEEFRLKSLRSSLIVSFDRIKFLTKEDYEQIFMMKGMMTNRKQRVESHAGFSATPVRLTRARSKTLMEMEQNQNKLKTGGFNCNKCNKTLKTKRGLHSHKCK